MNKLGWKIFIPLFAGIGATVCAVAVFKLSGIQNIAALIGVTTLAGALGNQLFTFLGRQLMRLNSWLIRARQGEVVFSFNRLPESESCSAKAGGKGRFLAKLRQEGYPVPDGCVVLSTAFSEGILSPEGRDQVEKELKRLRNGKPVLFAVRSSALQEDSVRASFAGEFESVLNVSTDEDIFQAVSDVIRSGQSERVHSYSESQGLSAGSQPMAVVIQKMVQPDYAGVLFTADPITGNLSQITGNFVAGPGEKLVSGQVTARTFTIDRIKGKYDGPDEIRPHAKNLQRLAQGIEGILGCPQDIEWAVIGKKISILQARPITTLNGFDPVTAVWNDSHKGRFMWSATNLMEACPDVLTPFTASLLPYLTQRGGPSLTVKGYPINGIIGGRFYVNISVQVSAFARMFRNDVRRTYRELSGWWGEIPGDLEIPLIPLTGEEWFKQVFPELNKSISLFGKYRKQAPRFLAENQQICQGLRDRIARIDSKEDLFDLWTNEIFPRYRDSFFYIVANSQDIQVKVERELNKLVGPEDANALLSNLSGKTGQLESMGPLSGLALVAEGKMSREEYLDNYGHRGVNEGEAAWPRPLEDPKWLDRQLEEWRQSPRDIDALKTGQQIAFDEAWDRFSRKFPNRVGFMKKRLAEVSAAAHMRERVRSEATRGMTVIRAFALRVGHMMDVGEDVFFLTIDEVLEGLASKTSAMTLIPQRKELYEQYCALPPYPALICGRFDPFAWAADPDRRSDVYVDCGYAAVDNADKKMESQFLHGFAGALGVVEGSVRRLDSLEESGAFKSGEILVTPMTNIGWTPIFPRAAAIVTDLGAPLSHAAIVARELGIPAVVGCGNATMKLKTGDRVRVDGGRGLVEIL